MVEIKKRELVVPGERIVESIDYLPGKNCFRDGNAIYAKKLGLVNVNNRVISVIPLNSVYVPNKGDLVIGEIKEVQSNGWVVNINSPYEAYLPLSGIREFIDTSKVDLSKIYDIGNIIYSMIATVTSPRSVHLSMQDTRARKFRDGRITSINPAKVPRLIGKAGSMISLIKQKTGCNIVVGQNGLIWLHGEKEDLVIKAIRMIEEESQVEGLTDKIGKLLEGKKI